MSTSGRQRPSTRWTRCPSLTAISCGLQYGSCFLIIRRRSRQSSTRPSSWRTDTAGRVHQHSSTESSGRSARAFARRARTAARPPKPTNHQNPKARRTSYVATVFERVRSIVVEQLGVEEDEVVPNASFVDDLNADSLDLVELIMSLEEEFQGDGSSELEISDEDAEKIVTVQDAVDYLKDHGVEDK